MPADPQNPEGTSVRVKIVRNPDNIENDLIKEYITPWSKEKFDEIISYSVNNNHIDGRSVGTGPSFILVHPHYTNPVAATYEQMIAPDESFDIVFERIRAPQPEFKDFLNDMKRRTKAAEDENEHYR